MIEKYEDMYGQIIGDKTFDLTMSERLGAKIALQWIDQNPDQVPGRTITESEMDAKWDEATGTGKPNLVSTVHRFTQLLGFDVIPDPELTNAEKLNELICQATGSTNAPLLADYLDEAGVRAPGGDDD